MMIQRLKQLARQVVHVFQGRSWHWEAKEREIIAAHPFCAACGRFDMLNVHHVIPYHDDPSQELVDANLIVLCRGKGTYEDHFIEGHHRNWKDSNPHVRADAARLLMERTGMDASAFLRMHARKKPA